MYKIRWMNKESGYVGIGNVLTKTIDLPIDAIYRRPLNFKEAEKLCKHANKKYKRARHTVVEVCGEKNL